MKLSIKILLFVFAVLIANVQIASAVIAFPNIQVKATALFSFHNEPPKTDSKIIENDLENCCHNERDLVDYRNRGKGIEANAAKEGTTVFRAVDVTEAAIIKNTGKFSLQQGGVEAKYFAKSLEDAHWYGQRLYPNGYSIIQGTVKGPVNASQYWFPHVVIGVYVFPKQTLPYIIPH